MYDLELKALQYAKEAHDCQYRKGTSLPYITHPIEASTIASGLCSELGIYSSDRRGNIIAAALLHDVIEDCDKTKNDLEIVFNDVVAEYVEKASAVKKNGWRETREEVINRLEKETDLGAKIVVFSDKLSNLRAIARDHRIIGDKVFDRFKAQKDDIAWYYDSVREACKKEMLLTLEYSEYCRLMIMVF